MMEYATLPMPNDYPDYPDHFQIARYFDDYVDHFGLRDRIRFRTEVTAVEPGDGGSWEVSWEDVRGRQGSDTYRAVMVANGHHWNPRWPEPPFPGSHEFSGEQIHVHDYKEHDMLACKRVLVLGIGNSATDLAVESSRIADHTILAMRRGAYILPKYVRGKPTDELGTEALARMPFVLQRWLLSRTLRVATGDVTDFGLPQPDHRLGEAHPTVSSDLLPRIGHGDIEIKPNIECFEGDRIRFVDGTEASVHLVIYCTGYRITFPFFREGFLSAPDNRISLYRRVVDPEHPGLFFIGLVQPLGAIMPIAEAQSEWVADVLEGKVKLPDPEAMRRVIEREDERMGKRYVASKRHTIQVDFHPYLRAIQRERRGGGLLERLRARRSHELRLR